MFTYIGQYSIVINNIIEILISELYLLSKIGTYKLERVAIKLL